MPHAQPFVKVGARSPVYHGAGAGVSGSDPPTIGIDRHTRLLTVGDRAFPVAWNDLPRHVKSASSLPVFRSRLRTHLFRRSFSWLLFSACEVNPVNPIVLFTYLLTYSSLHRRVKCNSTFSKENSRTSRGACWCVRPEDRWANRIKAPRITNAWESMAGNWQSMHIGLYACTL